VEMRTRCGVAAALVLSMPLMQVSAAPLAPESRPHHEGTTPLVVGHRGASGYVPEHTLASYFIAIQQGADYVEPDLVSTKDGVLITRHENEIGGTTDVGEKPEFASRRTTKSIDGSDITGWFTEDFTLAEIKTLRARERIPENRPANTRFDGQFEIPTLDEVLALILSENAQRAEAARKQGLPRPKPIGVYIETKHPTYFDSVGLSLEEPLVRALNRHGYTGKRANVILQSFEVSNLKDLNRMTRVPLAQLLDTSGQPYDFTVKKDPRTYRDLTTPAGLREIASYADGIGAHKNLIIPRTSEGTLGQPTTLVADAHANGLVVHGWTFRAENPFLPTNLREGVDPAAHGDVLTEMRLFLETGMDGFFTDHPDLGATARDVFVNP